MLNQKKLTQIDYFSNVYDCIDTFLTNLFSIFRAAEKAIQLEDPDASKRCRILKISSRKGCIVFRKI
jgi:hypothetical protein